MTAALLFPARSIGEELDFIPRLEYLTGSLELDMQRRDFKTTVGNRTTEIVYDASVEKMRFDGDGYVYHPRFLLFHLGGAAGLIQDYSTIQGGTAKENHGFDEYNVDVTLLPEHPYNLELFVRQQIGASMPFTPQSMTTFSEGALFRYKQRPLTFHLDAIYTSYERGSGWNDSKQYDAVGSYQLGPTTNDAGYNRTDTTTSQGEETIRTYSYFNNTIGFDPVFLTSNVGSGRQDQSDLIAGQVIETDTTVWSERLTAQLPYNLSLNAEHDYRNEDITTSYTTLSLPPAKTFNKNTINSLTLTHQLYNSLRTVYFASDQTIQTQTGEQDSSQQMLSFNYTKNIPNGTFRAGFSYQDLLSTRKGAATLLNEPHRGIPAPGGFFSINNPAVDISTIVVTIKDPAAVPPMNPVTMSSTDYIVQQFGTSVQIQITNVPIPTSTNGLYDFEVTYALLPFNSETDTKTKSFNLGLYLFEGLFGPYFSYTTSDLKVLSGTFPGGDTLTVTKTFGYSVQRKPFTFLMERTDNQSVFNPYRSLRGSMEYQEAVTEDTEVIALLSVNRINHLATEISKSVYAKTTTTEVTVHKVFARANFHLFVGGNYTVIDETGLNTKNYTLNTNLQWHIGKLDVSAIGSKTYSVSVYAAGRETAEQDAYYLTVSRRIF